VSFDRHCSTWFEKKSDNANYALLMQLLFNKTFHCSDYDEIQRGIRTNYGMRNERNDREKNPGENPD